MLNSANTACDEQLSRAVLRSALREITSRARSRSLAAIARRTSVYSAIALMAIACDSTAPAIPSAFVPVGAALAGTVGEPVDHAPRIEIRDASGRPIGGVPFTARVVSGSGTFTQSWAKTIPGATPIGSWVLGPVATAQALVVESPGFSPITFSVVARAGAPVSAVASDVALAASARINSPYVAPPAIVVRDQFGNLVPSATITVSITGGGTVQNASPTTDANGRASVGVWTLGATIGVQTLTMSAGGSAPPVVFTATASEPYNVVVRFIGTPPSAAVQAAFANAANRMERAIVDGVPPITLSNFNAAAQCQTPLLAPLTETVDDLLILAEIIPLDGVGGLLGQAGPCGYRSPGPPFPYVGVMEFDVADVNNMVNAGTFGSVVLHEMNHILGFGTLWQSLGLLSGVGSANPIFTGALARSEYLAAGGTSGAGVPVESSGGAGTALSHWRETVFRDELMTGFLTGPVQPYSRTTIASLAAVGYNVSYDAADLYIVPPPGLRASSQSESMFPEWERVLMPSVSIGGFSRGYFTRWSGAR